MCQEKIIVKKLLTFVFALRIFVRRMETLHPSNSCSIQIMTFDPTMGGDDTQPTQGDEMAAPEEQKEEGADDMGGGEEAAA